MSANDGQAERHRLDKWLWCTRFFKTRSLAADAVNGGKVHVNGERVKASRALRLGDRVTLMLQGATAEFDVLGFPLRRGSAYDVPAYCVEIPESVERRTRFREQHRLADLSRPRSESRPNKRDRRRLIKFHQGA